MALEFTKLVNGKELDVVQEQIEVLDGRVTTNTTDIADIKTQLENLPSGGGSSSGGLKIESYTDTSLGSMASHIADIWQTGKLIGINFKVKSTMLAYISNGYAQVNIKTGTIALSSNNITIPENYIYRLTPLSINNNYRKMFFTTKNGSDTLNFDLTAGNDTFNIHVFSAIPFSDGSIGMGNDIATATVATSYKSSYDFDIIYFE